MPIPNLNPLGYQGLKELNPPNIFFRDRAPLTTDYKLYDLLDFWQDTVTKTVYILISKQANIAIWVPISVGAGNLDTLTPDVGAAVTPVANNINIQGGLTGAISFSNGGAGQMNAAVQVDGVTIGIVGNQLTFIGVIPPPVVFTWIETAVGLTMAVDTGYIANGGVLVNLTLPAIAPQGTIQRITGKGVGLWRMTANAGQTIYYGNQTTAVGGNLQATQQRDSIEVVCITASSEWNVLDTQGNLTVT